MVEVIPTIIAKDLNELQEKIKKVESFVDWVQIDVMDGQFVENTTWNEPSDLKKIETSLNLEAHLMIKEPEKYIDQWINSGVKRIIFHIEATDKIKEVIDQVKQAGLGVGLAINPETPVETVDQFVDQLDLILVMTVHPGQGGQDFLESSLGKIKQLRAKYKHVKIEVDGGINLETAPEVIQAGANLLASGTAIFKSDDIEQTVNTLKDYEYQGIKRKS